MKNTLILTVIVMFSLFLLTGCANNASYVKNNTVNTVNKTQDYTYTNISSNSDTTTTTQNITVSTQTSKNSTSTPVVVIQSDLITSVELASHNNRDDCWISYKNMVYDVTSYVPNHPGGPGKIIPLCGTSSEFEKAFTGQHGTSKVKILESMGKYKGTLQ